MIAALQAPCATRVPPLEGARSCRHRCRRPVPANARGTYGRSASEPHYSMQRVLLCSPDYLATVDVDPASDTYQQASPDAWQTATTHAAAAAAPPPWHVCRPTATMLALPSQPHTIRSARLYGRVAAVQVIHRTPVTNLGDELHHTSEWAGTAWQAAATAPEVQS